MLRPRRRPLPPATSPGQEDDTCANAALLVVASQTLSLFRRQRAPQVTITKEGIRVVAKGIRGQLIPLEDVMLVYTSLMPKGEDFREVLAIEFAAPSGDEVIVLDPAEGTDIGQTIQELKEALGGRWEDVYVGHKHLSRVRGSP